jgi:hypothetical protein
LIFSLGRRIVVGDTIEWGAFSMIRQAMLCATLILTGCAETETGPWLVFAGGGFVFDYAYGNAFYSAVLKPLRQMPNDTVLEARFEDPAGGTDLIVQQTVVKPQLLFSFRSPPVIGVKKQTPYRVEVRVLAARSGELLGTYVSTYKSDVDQSFVRNDAPAGDTSGAGVVPR